MSRTGHPQSVKRGKAENDMAGMRQAVWIAVLLSGWLAGAAVALAETVPLPTPAPAPKDRSTPPAPSTQSSTPAAPAAPRISTFLDSLNSLNPFSGKSHRPPTDPSAFHTKPRA